MNTKILQEIGLSSNEIKVYFALLEFDVATATKIVKKSQIPNSKVYPILDKLIDKGLVTFVIKNKVKHFQAVDPSVLIKILNEKEQKIETQKYEIEKLIPEILLRKKLAKEKQDATVFEGNKGIESVYETILNELNQGEEYYLINIPTSEQYKKWQAFFANFHLKREKKGIKVKVISGTEVKEIANKVFVNKPLSEIRFLEEPLPSSTLIYKDNVATFIFSEKPTAFVIHSKQNAEQYRKFFLNMWKRAKTA